MLLLVVTAMISGGWLVIAAAAMLIGLIYVLSGIAPGIQLLRMMLRLRWLLVSIVVVYAWFTPGQALLPVLGALSPSEAGIEQAIMRASVLLLIIVWVYWLTQVTSRQQMVQAVFWLTTPLSWLGLATRQTFVVRLALVLETIPKMQAQISNAEGPAGQQANSIADRAARFVNTALDEGERAELSSITIPVDDAPQLRDWLLLLTLLILFITLARV